MTNKLGLSTVDRNSLQYMFNDILENNPGIDVNKLLEDIHRKDVDPVEEYYSNKFHVKDIGKLTKSLKIKYEKISSKIIEKMRYLYDIKFKNYDDKFLNKVMVLALEEMHSKESWTLCHLETIVRDEYHEKMVDILDRILTEFKINH